MKKLFTLSAIFFATGIWAQPCAFTINPVASYSITCSLPTVSMSASPLNYTYTWISPGGTVTGSSASFTAAGNYSVTGSGAGCSTSLQTFVVGTNTTAPTNTVSPTSQAITCGAASPVTFTGTALSPSINVQNDWYSPLNPLPGGVPIASSGLTISVLSGSLSPGVYTLVTTNWLNGCTAQKTVTVTSLDAWPTFSMASTTNYSVGCAPLNQTTLSIVNAISTNTPPGVCSFTWLPPGFAGTLAAPPYGASTSTISPLPGTWTVVVADNSNLCKAMLTVPVIQNTMSPAVFVTGPSSVCANNSLVLVPTSTTPGVPSTFTLFPGGITGNSFSVTPAVTTIYTVTGVNTNNGCTTPATYSVGVIPSKSLTGNITNASAGNVILYKSRPISGIWDSVAYTPFVSSYTFNNVTSAQYYVKAVPTATNLQETYGLSDINWTGATMITHGCITNSSQDINVIPYTNIGSGPGEMSGQIIKGPGYGQKTSNILGQPIGGVIIKCGLNPGGNMVGRTISNAAGNYTLSGLPANAVGESYFLKVEIPGLDTNGTYHEVITAANPQLAFLDFSVDSLKINPINSVGIKKQSILSSSVLLYPNPAKNSVNIEYSLQYAAEVNIELSDVLGQSMKVLQPGKQSADKHHITCPLEGLASGVYFLKIKADKRENVLKLIITD